jgi:hypothetical protein
VEAPLEKKRNQGDEEMLRRFVCFGAVVAATLAVATPAVFANSAAESIKITGNAQLTAAAVLVQVSYSCMPSTSTSGFLSVQLEQGSVNSFGSADAVCDDKNHTQQIEVPGLFQPGSAQAQAFVEDSSFVAFAQTGWVELQII